MNILFGLILIIIGVLIGRKLTAVKRAKNSFSDFGLPLIWHNPMFVLIIWLLHWILEIAGIVLIVKSF